MLFDLRGRGRRRTVKIVYVTLAFLMGGGLVFFGIGGDVSGGLVDAITERTGSVDDTTKRLQERERAATRRAQADPENAELWAAVARARFNLAGVGDNLDQETGAYTAAGRRVLRSAGDAWERHLAVAEQPDDRVASLMVQAYAALGDGVKAVRAQEAVAEARNSAGTYATLAQLAYQSGQIRTGDLAVDKALELTEPDMRESLRGQLEALKPQATATPEAGSGSGDGQGSGSGG
jgi:tetratricopeptide (TPR) repeat protein